MQLKHVLPSNKCLFFKVKFVFFELIFQLSAVFGLGKVMTQDGTGTSEPSGCDCESQTYHRYTYVSLSGDMSKDVFDLSDNLTYDHESPNNTNWTFLYQFTQETWQKKKRKKTVF